MASPPPTSWTRRLDAGIETLFPGYFALVMATGIVSIAADLLDMLVSDVLAANPAAARAFIERRMGCVGCPFAPFETVTQAALAYGLDPRELAAELAAAGAGAASPEGSGQ